MCQKYWICKLGYDTLCHMHIIIWKIGIHIHCAYENMLAPQGKTFPLKIRTERSVKSFQVQQSELDVEESLDAQESNAFLISTTHQ